MAGSKIALPPQITLKEKEGAVLRKHLDLGIDGIRDPSPYLTVELGQGNTVTVTLTFIELIEACRTAYPASKETYTRILRRARAALRQEPIKYKRGGPRVGSGRKPKFENPMKTTTVLLTQEQIAYFTEVGHGNLSEGIRRCYDTMRLGIAQSPH